MDEKEKSPFNDPLVRVPRKRNMYTEVDTLDSPNFGMPPGHHSGARPDAVRRRKCATQMTQSADTIDWAQIIARVRDDKDKQAFAILFEHFAPRVKAFLMRSGADPSMAEECAQEVMATLWQKAHLFDPARASASTWIFTIARNRRIDAIRKQKRPDPEDLPWGPEEEPDQADILVLQQESEKLGEAIASLPDKQKELIEKAYFGDLSHSEIAAETGLPLGTIKSRIRLALDRLRHAMK